MQSCATADTLNPLTFRTVLRKKKVSIASNINIIIINIIYLTIFAVEFQEQFIRCGSPRTTSPCPFWLFHSLIFLAFISWQPSSIFLTSGIFYTPICSVAEVNIGDLHFVRPVRFGCFTIQIGLISLTLELQPAADLVHIDARDTNQLLETSLTFPVLGHSELSYRFTHERQTSLYHCQLWVTLQNGCNHHKQVLCLFNQIGLQFFLEKLKSSSWIDFALGRKPAFSTTPTYLLEDFLAPFQGHLKLSEVNQNFSIYLTPKRPHFMNSDNDGSTKFNTNFQDQKTLLQNSQIKCVFSGTGMKFHMLRALAQTSLQPGSMICLPYHPLLCILISNRIFHIL